MKKMILTLILINLILITSSFIGAFLTSAEDNNIEAPLGIVSVELEPYFKYLENGVEKIDKGESIYFMMYDENNNPIGRKEGVVGINISNENDKHHFKNFGVNIIIRSSVYTYFRIAIYEQYTLRYVSGGRVTEVSIRKDDYSPFNMDLDTESNPNGLLFDHRFYDGFLYYKEPIKGNLLTENGESYYETILPFITPYSSDQDYISEDERYSLQVGFIVEAVQSLDGPLHNWNLPNPPWKDENDNFVDWKVRP